VSIDRLSAIWPEWEVVDQLGEGSFGKVYKVVREEHGVTSNAAVKVISIPQNDAELASIRSEGLDDTGTRSYFEGIVTDFVNEIKLMQSMKGTSNVVSVEDYKVLEKTDKIGWDIFIRMELLTPLNDYIADKTLTETEFIKLGQDVCSALELCAQRNIMHRDIKPENIFVSSFGDFKVGDFGIARELEKTSGSLSQKGTYNYMAPEIKTSKHYDATVDIYSLGLVLYKLLNNNRLPFLDPNAQLIQYQDRKNAIDRRFSGEPMPAPINASPHLAQAILAACAFKPAERFQTPTAFKNALGAVKGENPSPVSPRPVAAPIDLNATTAARRAPEAAQPVAQEPDMPVASFGKEKKKKSKVKRGLVSLVILICLAGIATGAYILNPGGIFDGVRDVVGNIFGDPAADVIAALEDGDYAEALALAADADSDALRRRLEDRLDTLAADFLSENIEFSVVQMELNTIAQMNISGLSDRLDTTRTLVNNLNDSRTAFLTAETMFERGDYAGAIGQYMLVIQDDPNYGCARDGVRRSIDAFRTESLTTASSYSGDGDYESAIRILNDALRIIENDSELTQQLTLYTVSFTAANRQQALDTATAYASNHDWANAISTLNNALRTLPDDSLLIERLRSYERSYVTDVVSQADELVAENRHDDAIALINGALQTVPNDEELLARRATISDMRPIDIRNITSIENQVSDSDVRRDNFQNEYTNVVHLGHQERRAFLALLDGRYSRFRGTAIIPYGETRDGSSTIRFEADGRTIEVHDMDRATRAISFDIDLSDVNEFRIVTDRHWSNPIIHFAYFRFYP